LSSSYNISNSYNVSDLSLFDIGLKNLWSNSLQEGGDDDLSLFDIGLKNLWSNSLQEGGDDEDVTTLLNSKDANPRRITKSMKKGKAPSSLSLFCITLTSIS